MTCRHLTHPPRPWWWCPEASAPCAPAPRARLPHAVWFAWFRGDSAARVAMGFCAECRALPDPQPLTYHAQGADCQNCGRWFASAMPHDFLTLTTY